MKDATHKPDDQSLFTIVYPEDSNCNAPTREELLIDESRILRDTWKPRRRFKRKSASSNDAGQQKGTTTNE